MNATYQSLLRQESKFQNEGVATMSEQGFSELTTKTNRQEKKEYIYEFLCILLCHTQHFPFHLIKKHTHKTHLLFLYCLVCFHWLFSLSWFHNLY